MNTLLNDVSATENPFGNDVRIRIWTKDANTKRNRESVVDGGDFVPNNVAIHATNLFKNGATTVVLYIEGISTSQDWGTDKIKVTTTPIPGSGLTLPQGLTLTDEVSYTVVRNVFKMCVYRPYVCERDNGGIGNNVTTRTTFLTKYNTPRSMIDDYFEGMRGLDNYGTYKGEGAFMGHAFARVEIRMPGMTPSPYWTGQTGANKDLEMYRAYQSTRLGETFWFRAADGSEDDPAKTQVRYDTLYAPPLGGPVSGLVQEKGTGVDKKFIAVHEFRMRPETAKAIHDYRATYRSSGYFKGYGLDTVLKGRRDSRVGCGTYVAILMERAGLIATNKVIELWGKDVQMPVVPLPSVSVGLGEARRNHRLYRDGNNEEIIKMIAKIQEQAMGDVDQTPGVDSWTGGVTRKSLKFCDPALMAPWIDVQNARSHWNAPWRQYKDRGVTVIYNVPEQSNLDQWKRE